MSEYRITHKSGPHGLGEYEVGHYTSLDPNPTPTVHTVQGLHNAQHDAFGRAGKLSLLLGKRTRVVAEDGRIYSVTVRQVKK